MSNRQLFYIYKYTGREVLYFTEQRTFDNEWSRKRLFSSERDASREAKRLGHDCYVEQFIMATLI